MKQALILAILLVNRISAAEEAFRGPSFSFDLAQSSQFQRIYFDGELWAMPKTNETIDRFLSALVMNKDILFVIKNSQGGVLTKYNRLILGMRAKCEKKSGCKITMLLDDKCGSACVTLYMQGDIRRSVKRSTFGFHRKWVIVPQFVVQSKKKAIEYYRELGISADWMDKNRHIFKSRCQRYGCWITSDQALAAGIVQSIDK